MLSSTLHFLLFEGLTRLNPDGSVTPAQAETIHISKDQTRYTFTLKNTFWSDGTPVTAYDFEYAWKTLLDPHFPSPNASLMYPIKNAEQIKKGLLASDELGVKVVNKKCLEITLKQPTPYFLELISFSFFFPVKAHHEPESASAIVTNGPYQLDQWKRAQSIRVCKNPFYWAAEQIKIPSIYISMIASEMTTLHLYEKGELDLIDLEISPIPIEAQLDLAKRNLLQFAPNLSTTVCIFNTQAFPFCNAHIRKAFSLSINRGSLVKNVTQRGELPALQLVPASLKNGRTDSFIQDHDPEEANRELALGLQELGIEKNDLNTITYHYCSSDRNRMSALALQQQWREVLGINVQLKATELKLHMHLLFNKHFQLAQSQLVAQYNDPMNFLERFHSKASVKNYAGWENATYSRLLDLSFHAHSPEKRDELLKQAEALLMDELPLTPLYHGASGLLAKPYLQNVSVFKNGNPDFTRLSFKHTD